MYLIFFYLLLGQLIPKGGVTSTVSNLEDLRELYLNSIDEVFYRTTIERNPYNKIKYCIDNFHHREKKVIEYSNTVADLEMVLNKYTHLPNVNAVTLNDTNDPITDYGVLYLNESGVIPVYVKADIRARHIRPAYTHPAPGKDVDRQMSLMGQLDGDDRGYLLPYSLGGNSSALNSIPIARNVNRPNENTLQNISSGSNTTLWIPGSNFKSNEDWIHNFLTQYPNGRVSWTLACQYRHNIFIDHTRNQDHRPVSFAVQFTAYSNQYDIASVYLKSGPLTYLNNNDFGCEYEKSLRRYKRDIKNKHVANYIATIHQREGSKCAAFEEEHDILRHKSKYSRNVAKFIANIYYPEKSECGLGVETINRPSGDHNAEEVARAIVVPYSIGSRRFYYLSDEKWWFTYELNSEGTTTQVLSHGDWPQTYRVALIYSTNSKQFLYGCNNYTHHWMIREIYESGEIGEEISQGIWKRKCQVTFQFEYDGKNYFYSQTDRADGYHWWIQELLPDGKMGIETDHGNWNEDYQLACSSEINGMHFFLRHNHEKKTWYTTELLPGGRMGSELSRGTFHVRFSIAFSFVVVQNCKHYILAHSVLDGTEWFIYELLPGARIGKIACSGDFGERCPTAFRYEVEDNNFFYRRCMDTLQLYIQRLF